MSSMKSSKARKRVVKGWVVTVYDGAISHNTTDQGIGCAAVFFDPREAEKFIKEWTPYSEQNPRIAPCTITYSL